MRLIIVRHGKTIENEEGIMQGQKIGGTLSELGLKQTKEVALKLKDKKIDKIYSSDLTRCVGTAKEIAKFHERTPLVLAKELKERDFGEFTGKRKKDFGYSADILIGDILETKEGENIEEVIERVKNFFEKIKEKHKNETILIVGHNAINKIIISLISNKSLNEIKSQENTEINIFEI